jgi:hypothetical protein
VIKLPKDKYGNEGWLVKARKSHTCEGYRHTGRHIFPGDFYNRAICWPNNDANGTNVPWVLKLCRGCLHEEMQTMFDAAIPKSKTDERKQELNES